MVTDKLFIAAIQTDSNLSRTLGGRIYSTAIPKPDQDLDKVPLPYCIVAEDGLQNDQDTKDEPYESMDDTVQISITLTANTRPELGALAQKMRQTVLEYFRSHQTPVQDYKFSAEGVQYDAFKPCYWQVLRYQCSVNNE